jgi:uncharacterized protein (DUF2141 family)
MNIKLLSYVYLAVMCSITLIGCGFEREKDSAATVSGNPDLSNYETRIEDAPEDIKPAEGSMLPVTNDKEADAGAGISERRENKKAAEAKAVLPKRRPLTVNVSNLESPNAPVVMGIYGTQNKFPDAKDQLKEYRFKPKNGKLTAKIEDLTYGEFALAIYQDVNSDGKIDKNFIGIPEEPYGFSNNYKPTVKAPSFKDCRFEYNEQTNTVNISLIK